MLFAGPGIALAWFARGKTGVRRILRYILIGLHVAFMALGVGSSTEIVHEKVEVDDPPMSEEAKKEKERKLIDECAKSKDPLCGL
jgi:hypothetical protein